MKKIKTILTLSIAGLMAGIDLKEVWRYAYNSLLNAATTNGALDAPNMGFITFLLSDVNKMEADAKLPLNNIVAFNNGDGKIYKAYYTFYPRQAFNIHSNAPSLSLCDVTGTTSPSRVAEHTIRYYERSKPLIIDDDFLRNYQSGRADVLAPRLAEHLRSFGQFINDKAANLVSDPANGYIGSRAGFTGNAPIELPLFLPSSATGQGVNDAGELLLDDIASMHGISRFTLIGGGQANAYRTKKGYTDVNLAGVNAQRMEVIGGIYRDNRVTNTLNSTAGTASGALAVAAGALRLVTYCKNKGEFAHSDDRQRRFTMMHPTLGVEVDVFEVIDVCGDEIKRSWTFGLGWDVIGQPCWSDDPMYQGVTDVLAVDITCSDKGVCDVIADPTLPPSTPPTPLTPSNVSTMIDCTGGAACMAGFTVARYPLAAQMVGNKVFAVADLITGLVVTANGSSYNLQLTSPQFPNGYLVGSSLELAAADADVRAQLISQGVTNIEWGGFYYDTNTSELFGVIVAQDASTFTSADVVLNVGGFSISTPNASNLTLITSVAQPSSGATIASINYAPIAVSGAPNAKLNWVSYQPAIGTVGRFYIDHKEVTDPIVQAITDSAGCTNTVNQPKPA